MNRRLALWLMVGCIMAAAALRIPSLTEMPPGLHFDEAANGILAGDIGLRGEWPLFITSYTGKETFFFYAAGVLMRLVGESVFALRLAAAFLGLLTVAATYRVTVELLWSRIVAVLASALITVSFWHILFSRLGFRAISQPLLQALTVAILYYGLRKRSWLWAIVGGAILGLTAYTYLAARIFPFVLALSLIPLAVQREERSLRLRQLAVFFGSALVVALPLLIFFIRNPDTFWVRIDQVSPDSRSLLSYFESYRDSLGMFFVLGDPYWRFNIPGRPIFNWFWGGLAVIGWLVSGVRTGRERDAKVRSAYLLLALTPLIMILPTALAIEEIVPSNLRAIGTLPFITLLPAIGLLILLLAFQGPINNLYLWLTSMRAFRRLPDELPDNWATSPKTLTIIFLLILAVGGLSSWQLYFQEWSSRDDLFYDSDADLAAVAEYLDDEVGDVEKIFVSSQHYRHPTLAFLSDRYDEVKWLPGGQALVIPDKLPATYIYPASSPMPEWTAGYLPARAAYTGPPGPDNQPTFNSYLLDGFGPDLALGNQRAVNFGNIVTLRGYEVGKGKSGELLAIDLLWQVESVPSSNYVPFVHLEDAWRHRWSQAEPFVYPAEQWEQGDLILQRVELTVPVGAPAGDYLLRIGMFDPESTSRLPVIDVSGRYGGSSFAVENVIIEAGDPLRNLPVPEIPTNLQMNPKLKLLGYERSGEQVEAGTTLPITIWWQSEGPLEPMTMRFELIGSGNQGQIISNTEPVHGAYPFDQWQEPQFVIDYQDIPIPESMALGEYRLLLRLLDRGDETIMTADLGPVRVEESQRLYSAPETQFPQSAVFGGEIALVGYDITSSGPGKHLLDLVWNAIDEPENDYTVFVHVLEQDGSCCVWQDDNWPQQGAAATSRWRTGEYVLDPYTIELPEELAAGQYPLEIGLYLAESGQRMQVEVPRLAPGDALILRPLVIE